MECLHQFNIANPSKDAAARRAKPIMTVSCGRCMPCTQRKARNWAFRLHNHNKIAKTAYFITLTYNDANAPFNKDITYLELDKQHLINFFMRLRRNNNYKYPDYPKIKYYAVGEYGGKHGRPHYHAILFNCHQKIINNLEKIWYQNKSKDPMGTIKIDAVNMDTISYVTGYIINRDISKSDDYKREREFSIMSKGLGANYITDNFKYHQENLTFKATFQGKTLNLPDYYKQKIFEPEQIVQISEEIEYERNFREQKEIERLTKLGHKNPLATIKAIAFGKAKAAEKKIKRNKL